uniref:Uncharacterized protein n=2 Tax=Anthoceros TaxID=3233 RepID=A0A6M8B140_ANTPU|nr:hypothetical protein [Anthoceros punctatus]YP_009863172.1 hypothetical protein [Anthoceros agrestis]QKD76586.1 hypothetical protein [Anthoceros punctatus]QKD76628.1 hypothetical protein [Anthoceros agrestis]
MRDTREWCVRGCLPVIPDNCSRYLLSCSLRVTLSPKGRRSPRRPSPHQGHLHQVRKRGLIKKVKGLQARPQWFLSGSTEVLGSWLEKLAASFLPIGKGWLPSVLSFSSVFSSYSLVKNGSFWAIFLFGLYEGTLLFTACFFSCSVRFFSCFVASKPSLVARVIQSKQLL